MKCGQQRCTREATCAFHWPGNTILPSCDPCYAWANRVAAHLGFALYRLDVRPLEEMEAREAIACLKTMEQST